MHQSSGPLAITCLATMYVISKSAALLDEQLGAFFAAVQLLLVAGFCLNCVCGYLLLRAARRLASDGRQSFHPVHDHLVVRANVESESRD